MTSPDDLDYGQTIQGLSAGRKVFQRYTLVRILGRGGMGVVWLAHDEQLEREVALKFLPDLVMHDLAVLDDLKRETRRSLRLTHHNIVRIHDFVQDAESACISMEYIDGPTLSALRVDRANKVFEPEELGPWIKQMCGALEYAHDSAKIVHRDLKPVNLMLTSRGDLKVADFGIARSLSDSVSLLTMARGTSGTLAYMSPQQITGERPTHLDDIYSLGATLYELLTGRPPFYSGDITDQIKTKQPQPMSQRRRDLDITSSQPIPVHWEQTIMACLAKDPSQRPQSAAEVALRIGVTVPLPPPLVTPAPISPPPPIPVSAPPLARTSVSRTRSLPLVGAGLAILTLLGIVVYLVATRNGAQPVVDTAIATQTPAVSVAPIVTPPPTPVLHASISVPEPVATIAKTAPVISSTPASVLNSAGTLLEPANVAPPPVIESSRFPSNAASSMAGEQYPETRTRLLSSDEVRLWNDAKLRYAINELYARGGYDFQTPEVRALFAPLPWYQQRWVKGRSQDQAAAQLSRTEYLNLALLQKERDRRR
jgi:serine/threonine protein kinase